MIGLTSMVVNCINNNECQLSKDFTYTLYWSFLPIIDQVQFVYSLQSSVYVVIVESQEDIITLQYEISILPNLLVLIRVGRYLYTY